MKKNLITLLFCFITAFVCLGQNHGDSINKGKLYYDDWPTTVEANATRKLISKDPGVDYVLIGTTWDHRIITYFFQNGTNDIDADNERQAIRDAFALWTAQTDLFFLQVCSEDDADIVFLWGTFNHGDAGPFDGEGGVLAHTLGGPPPNNFGDQAGDMHFDDSEAWTLDTRPDGTQPIDLVTVAAHEIGHALGLDHTTVSGSLMLAEYTGSHRFLGSDDIGGIRYLYGLPGANLPISGPSLVCSSGATFSVNNLPTGASLNWESHSSNLELVSSQGNYAVLRALTNSEIGWVEVSVLSECGAYTLPRLNNIYIGTQIPGPITYQMDSPPRRFTAQTSGAPTATSYNWYKNGVLNTTYHNDAAIFTRTSPYCGHSYYVEVELVNACGTSARRGKTVIEPSCLLGLTIYPNPASQNIEVILENASDISDPFTELLNESVILTSNEFFVNVTDLYGNKVYNSKVDDKRFTLSVAGFKNGTYVVTVTDNKIIWQGTLIVNH